MLILALSALNSRCWFGVLFTHKKRLLLRIVEDWWGWIGRVFFYAHANYESYSILYMISELLSREPLYHQLADCSRRRIALQVGHFDLFAPEHLRFSSVRTQLNYTLQCEFGTGNDYLLGWIFSWFWPFGNGLPI